MADDPHWWSSPVSDEAWSQRLAEAKARAVERYQRERAEDEARSVRRAAMWKEFGNDGVRRREAIWREHREEGATLQAIGDRYGVTKERVRQIVAKRDREIKKEQTND